MADLLVKLNEVRNIINSRVFERAEETDGILLAVLAGVNMLFLGDVGTAKTYQLQIAGKLLGLRMFDILLSETTQPAQIFGPTDIPALAMGKQQTKYIGYAPDAEIVFFDEIFKANSTVLNPLLWLINEKQFRDGDNGVRRVPLLSAFAASNEIPSDDIMKACYDRFLLRYVVKYLKDESNVKALIKSSLTVEDAQELKPILTLPQILKLRDFTRKIIVPDKVRDLAIAIRRNVEMAMGYEISDRRFTQAFRVMQASAVLARRKEVRTVDVEVLSHILWNDWAHVDKVRQLVGAQTSDDTAIVSTHIERAQLLKSQLMQTTRPKRQLAELKVILREVSQLHGWSARKAVSEIKSTIRMYRHLLNERKEFHVVQFLDTSTGTDRRTYVFKVSSSTSNMWPVAVLRSLGLKYRRKMNYWYYPHNSCTALAEKLVKHGSSLKLTKM